MPVAVTIAGFDACCLIIIILVVIVIVFPRDIAVLFVAFIVIVFVENTGFCKSMSHTLLRIRVLLYSSHACRRNPLSHEALSCKQVKCLPPDKWYDGEDIMRPSTHIVTD